MIISRDQIADPNAAVQWESVPTDCHCPHCDEAVTTFIEYKASFLTYVVAFFAWVLFGWFSIFLLPIIFPAFKEDVHHCPKCLNVLHKQSRLRLPEFKADVMTLKMGNCAMVLSMKYVLMFVIIVFVILAFQLLRGMNFFEITDPGKVSTSTWKQFLEDCTPPRGFRNPSLGGISRLSQNFDAKYRLRNVVWDAEVMSIREGLKFLAWKTENMMVARGIPPQYPSVIPDMILMFPESMDEKVSDLIPPAYIRFNATIAGLGRRGTAHLLKVWDFDIIDKPEEAAPPAEPESNDRSSDLENVVKKLDAYTAEVGNDVLGSAEVGKGALDSGG